MVGSDRFNLSPLIRIDPLMARLQFEFHHKVVAYERTHGNVCG